MTQLPLYLVHENQQVFESRTALGFAISFLGPVPSQCRCSIAVGELAARLLQGPPALLYPLLSTSWQVV